MEDADEDDEERIDLSPDLFYACKAADATAALALLDQGVAASYEEDHWTCMHWAARHGLAEVVERLTWTGRPGTTPLHWAALYGHMRVVWLLVEAGIESTPDEVGNTPLHLAATGGHVAVVRALLDDGADATALNLYGNAPLDLAASSDVRRLVTEHLDKNPSGVGDKAAVAAYREATSELKAAMSSGDDRLAAAVRKAAEKGVASELVDTGRRALVRLQDQADLKEHVAAVKAAAPIVTQEAYCQLVNRLSRLRKNHEVDHGGVLDEADALATRSHTEYWLHTRTERLDALECADDSARQPMAKLANAIHQADVRRADVALVDRARAVLARTTAELEVREALAAVPSVRLPVADPADDYWQPEEDLGRVDDAPPFPLPGDDGYKWIPSSALSSLRDAATRLQRAITQATQANAQPDLLTQAEAKQASVADDLKQLERKDLEDRDVAVANAEKAAKKLKKKKKK